MHGDLIELKPSLLHYRAPDGIVLAKDSAVIEFISYEGSFTGASGVAAGLASTDIGVSETSSTSSSSSLQRTGTGCFASDFTWTGPSTASMGSLNAGQTISCGPAPPTGPPVTGQPTPSPTPQPTPAPVPTQPTPSPTPQPTPAPVPTGPAPSLPNPGSFSSSISAGQTITVGTFVSGTSDIYIDLDSSIDVDVRLYDGATLLEDSVGFTSNDYGSYSIEYSGTSGEVRSDGLGEEFAFISGTIDFDLTLRIYANAGSGSATVKWSWGYYDTATGSGATLKSQLHEIIDDHTELSYTPGCWEALRRTDQHPTNPDAVIGLYSRNEILKVDQDNGSGNQDAWNREHVWAKSHGNFGTTAGPGTDIHALRAADRSVNTERSAKDFDNGGLPLSGADSQADCPSCLETSTTFEPPNEVKGAVARMILYMDVRYNGDSNSNGVTLTAVGYSGTPFGSSTSGNGELGNLVTLLEWHNAYPVNDEELRRNNIIHSIQGNRNPFIDHPEWVSQIF